MLSSGGRSDTFSAASKPSVCNRGGRHADANTAEAPRPAPALSVRIKNLRRCSFIGRLRSTGYGRALRLDGNFHKAGLDRRDTSHLAAVELWGRVTAIVGVCVATRFTKSGQY